MIKENGVVTALSWVKDLLSFGKSRRKRMLDLALDSITKFKGGEKSKEGERLVEGLLKDSELVGFIPNVSYIKIKGDPEDMNSIFVHPFSAPAMLYKVKGSPVLLVTNAYIDYNSTRLEKIPHNKYQKELMKIIKNSLGITG